MSAVESFGVIAIVIMVSSYALEDRHPHFIALFSIGCTLAAFYAYLIQSLPFLLAEGTWAVIAFRRWLKAKKTVYLDDGET